MSQAFQQDEQQNHYATMVDQYVGRRIRKRRIMMGLSQRQLARIIGVTYQQVHKYEQARTRISTGRLFTVAQALSTDPTWFFEGITDQGAVEELPLRERLCLELVRNFFLIKTEKHQQAISSMARLLAGL